MDWKKLAEKSSCVELASPMGNTLDASLCAAACRGSSTIFAYMREDSGMCDVITGCACFCEAGAREDATCTMRSNNIFDLYKFPGE